MKTGRIPKIKTVLAALSGQLLITGYSGAAPAPASIPFSDALRQIMERSTRVGIEEQSYLSLKAANLPTRLFLLPTLTGDVNRVANDFPGSAGIQRSNQAVLRADLNLFRFGADYKGLTAAQNDESRQGAVVQTTVIQTEDQAIRTLVTVIQRRLELDVYQRQVQLKEESYKIAQERYRHGLLAEQEMRKSLVDLENSRSARVEANFLLIDAEATLMDLLGSTQVQTVWPWKARLASENIDAFVRQFEFKVADRPDWAAAQFRISAQEDLVSRNYRLMLPSIDTSFSYGYYHYEAVDNSIPSGTQWRATIGITVPFFDRLVNYSNARAQTYLTRQAEIQRTEVERNAPSQFEAAKTSLSLAVSSAKEREKTLNESISLYQDSLRRFQNGRADTNELLIDQSRLLDSERLAVAGWAEAHVAVGRFCHELGKRLSECGNWQ